MNEAIGSSLSIGGEDDRETKENALKQLLGNEDLNVQDLTDEALDIIMRRLTGIDEIEESVDTLVSVMRELKASEEDIVEALSVNLEMHLSEAKEIYQDFKLKG